MSEEAKQVAVRRKRVQRLKRYIIVILLILVLVPWVVCAVLSVQLYGLHSEFNSLFEAKELLEQRLNEMEASWQSVIATKEVQDVVEAAPQQGMVQEKVEDTAPDKKSDEAAHKVYITFDDGPSVFTKDILDILKAYEVKATFFVVGKEGEYNEQMLKRIVEEGHSIGIHSYSHQYTEIYESVDAFAADLDRIRNHILSVTGVESNIYRFPGGSSNKITDINIREFGAYLQSRDIQYYDWNISSGDASQITPDAATIVQNSISQIADRKVSIILLHDAQDKAATVEALPQIIENILAVPDTVILPITEDTEPVQHIQISTNE